jgi:tryptophan synthase alpha chain
MRLTELTRARRADGVKPLVPFLTAGYPDEETFVRLVGAASRAGCAVLEIGIPFSDPVADGPLIQESSQQALRDGMTLRRALDLAADAVRRDAVAPIFMSYINPILAFGVERFAGAAEEAGVAGLIVPDLPFEEAAEVRASLAARGVALIDLVAPTSDDGRIARMAPSAEGFVYLVSRTGVTGVRASLDGGARDLARRVRAHTDLPLYVGFGVSSAAQAAIAAEAADGVIVGSALIERIRSSRTRDEAVERVTGFLEETVRALADPRRSDP